LLLTCIVWAACLAFRRQVSVGSLVAAAFLPVAALLWGSPASYTLYASLAAALIWYRHRENIERLLAGTEPTIGQRLRLS
jgi:glycerol-3-phosphate acyltransferase PlsY